MSTTTLPGNSGTLLLVDSGACMSTCPREWCEWAPVRDGDLPNAVTATGSALTIYGMRRLRCTTWYGEAFDLNFV
eukprot:332227-Heterocapsa_arctica.AAC.1